jgi:hypothetical protein
MDNVQTQENFISEPSSQTFKSYVGRCMVALWERGRYAVSYSSIVDYFPLVTSMLWACYTVYVCKKIKKIRDATRIQNSVLWNRRVNIITKTRVCSSLIGSVTTYGAVMDGE